jgi:hypothetical protein
MGNMVSAMDKLANAYSYVEEKLNFLMLVFLGVYDSKAPQKAKQSLLQGQLMHIHILNL